MVFGSNVIGDYKEQSESNRQAFNRSKSKMGSLGQPTIDLNLNYPLQKLLEEYHQKRTGIQSEMFKLQAEIKQVNWRYMIHISKVVSRSIIPTININWRLRGPANNYVKFEEVLAYARENESPAWVSWLIDQHSKIMELNILEDTYRMAEKNLLVGLEKVDDVLQRSNFDADQSKQFKRQVF